MPKKIEYGYEPRQVLFVVPEDMAGHGADAHWADEVPARDGKTFVVTDDWPAGVLGILYDWIGGGYRRAKRRDLSVPLQVGNMDWGFTPASVRVRS